MIEETTFWSNPATILSLFGLAAAAAAAWGPLQIYLMQKRREDLKMVTQLHDKWWSAEFTKYRADVWKDLEAWKVLGNKSPVIGHYSGTGEVWSLDDPRRIAHTRVLFFFSDVSIMLRRKIVDEDMTFEVLGIHQYHWFQGYITAIRQTVLQKTNGKNPPFYLYELEGFDRRFEKWKDAQGSRFRGFEPV